MFTQVSKSNNHFHSYWHFQSPSVHTNWARLEHTFPLGTLYIWSKLSELWFSYSLFIVIIKRSQNRLRNAWKAFHVSFCSHYHFLHSKLKYLIMLCRLHLWLQMWTGKEKHKDRWWCADWGERVPLAGRDYHQGYIQTMVWRVFDQQPMGLDSCSLYKRGASKKYSGSAWRTWLQQ